MGGESAALANRPGTRAATDVRGGSAGRTSFARRDALHQLAQGKVADGVFGTVARTAIVRAAQNFGLGPADSRAFVPKPAKHGVLNGQEAIFAGSKGKTAMDVRVFVGQSAGRFPVVLTLYTLRGKMHHLDEHVRRAWSRISYL